MSTRKWLIGATLIVVSSGMVFANGAVEDDDYRQGGRKGGPQGDHRGGMNYEDIDTQTVEGTFTMVDGEYPAIITDDGETLYLMIHAGTDDIPAEGANLVLEAFPSPMSPVHIMVVSAEVDGVELDLDDDYGPGGRGGRGGRNGGGMYGDQGSKPGWGYEDSDDE